MRRNPRSYSDAIQWLVDNDDNEWLHDDGGDYTATLSVSASLVADMYGRTDAELTADLRKAVARAGRAAAGEG